MPGEEPDHRRVRVGLALVAGVVVVAVALFFVVDSALGKAIMGAIAFTAVVRMYLLTRDVRRG